MRYKLVIDTGYIFVEIPVVGFSISFVRFSLPSSRNKNSSLEGACVPPCTKRQSCSLISKLLKLCSIVMSITFFACEWVSEANVLRIIKRRIDDKDRDA